MMDFPIYLLIAPIEIYVILNLEENCQLNCVFCRRQLNFDPNKRPSFQTVIKMISDCKDEYINFSGGGEPTMDPFLARYIFFAHRLGKTTRVETNGVAFSDEKYLKSLLDAGLDEIILTVPSHIPEIYDEIVQLEGAFDLLKKALKNLSKFPEIVRHINIPSTKLNMTYEHFVELIEFLRKYVKGNYLNFNAFRPNDAEEFTNKYLPDYGDLGKELSKIFTYCRKEKIQFNMSPTTSVPPCKIKGFEDICSIHQDFHTYYDHTYLFTHPSDCDKCIIKDRCVGIPKTYLKLRKFTPEPFSEIPESLKGKR